MTVTVNHGEADARDSVGADARGGGNAGHTGGTRSGSGESSDFSIVPLGWLAGGTAVVGLILYGVQQSLRLPSGYGVEDLLGWSTTATIAAAILNWCTGSERWRAAAAYVLCDTAFFMPFYGALILAAARDLGKALQPGPAPVARIFKVALQPLTWLLVLALWLVDGLENLGGAQRLGIPTWSFAVSFIVAVVLFLALWRTVLAGETTRKSQTCQNAGTIAVAILVITALVMAQDGQALCNALGRGPYALAWAHHDKPVAVLLALSPLAAAAVVWWFGVDLAWTDPAQKLMAELRAAWRAGVAGVIGRSRYVLLLLALFATFTLVLDQCRDVLLALAGPLGADANRGAAATTWRVVVLILGAGSVGMLAYSSWLWTRLVGMVQRPGLSLPGNHDVYARIGEFARGWARAVSLVPLAIVCLLIAHTVGDAAAAARASSNATGQQTLSSTLAYLFLFGILAVAGGYAFLELRRRLPLPWPSDYYDSESDVLELLREGTIRRRRIVSSPIGEDRSVPVQSESCVSRLHSISVPLIRKLAPLVRRVVPFTRPVFFPLVALCLMVILRAGIASDPDIASQAPATLALLALALVWWMGVSGALSLVEQRQTIPWGLVVLGVVGLLSLVVDNHVLPLNLISVWPVERTLEIMRGWGFVVTLSLASAGAVWWWAATFSRPAALVTPRLTPRLLASFGAMLVALFALYFVDRRTSDLIGPAATSEVATLDESLKAWVEKLGQPSGTNNRVFLVASEGGGVRSAYWTARVLARLHDRENLDFDRRAFVLSGVSGGAIGEAVYRACSRELRPGEHVGPCIKQRFARLDALSPLIGSFMFEDVFARALPLDAMSICQQPGCGFLSRALPFEREWIRQFPLLAAPIGGSKEGQPELMLNSTEVESGNRVVFSTLRLNSRDIPASVDAVRRLGAEPSLIAAAHSAARFPFINPLAEVRPASGGSEAGKIVAHLADGGYHDNSGAESLSDVWRALRPLLLASNWRPQLVLIRNGQLKAGCEERLDKKDPPPACLDAKRVPSSLAGALNKPLMKLYADLLGPPVAVVNVSGIGAHARQAAGTVDADLRTYGPVTTPASPAPRPCLLDQTTEATLVPLGWYLSSAAREALDAEVGDALNQVDCFPEEGPAR